ncbi:hypothetical protein Y036_6183 [Burkholderia pseudomallei]|uniref:Uncharacterized protein n=1 Tax=Burkholderia pseudomallei TaxID=28450 RepID=A0AA40JJ14_BURPE|nr:hypothetical protein Y036_6183 [Burkholderia pseudomallei]
MDINGLSILVEQAMHLNPMIVFAQNASILSSYSARPNCVTSLPAVSERFFT